MSKADFAALIALCAALASAIGDVVRQRSAHEITDKQVGHLELFSLSVRDKRWWLGAIGAVVNYSLQAAALALGSVMLVTALQVTSLLFALPIYARLAHHRVTRSEWMSAVLLAAALAILVTVGHPGGGHWRGALGIWVAVVAGSSLALFAVLTKGAVGAVSGGFGALLRAPEGYALIPAALAGMIFQQSSFRAGALTASLPTVTVAKPVVAALLGVLVLGETLNADGPTVFVLIAAAVVVIVSTIALARGEAATLAAGAGRDVIAVDKTPSPR